MKQVQFQLDDQLYQEARRRAAATGYETVDEYVAEIVQHDLEVERDDINRLLTPELLASVDQAFAEIDAGQGIPLEKVREHFRQRFENER